MYACLPRTLNEKGISFCSLPADINECLAKPCAPHATCTNFDSGYTCDCDEGYERNGERCESEYTVRVYRTIRTPSGYRQSYTGALMRTYKYTRSYAHTYARKRRHACSRIHTDVRARSCTLTRSDGYTWEHARTHACAHVITIARTHTHARTHAGART